MADSQRQATGTICSCEHPCACCSMGGWVFKRPSSHDLPLHGILANAGNWHGSSCEHPSTQSRWLFKRTSDLAHLAPWMQELKPFSHFDSGTNVNTNVPV